MTWQPGLFSDEEIRVAANVKAIAEKYYVYDHIPVLVHLGVTRQESGWNDSAAGDNQQSFGPYQIYVQAHPEITPGVSTDPWYDYGYPTMHSRWASSWLSFAMQWPNGSEDDRGWILEQFAPAAQGSIAWTPGLGLQRYHEAVAMLERLS